jgi:molecular chaperone GrpE
VSDPTLDDIENIDDPGVPGGPAPAEEAAPLPEEAELVVAPGDDAAPGDGGTPSVEDILGDLERVTAERDEFLALAQSKQAELENLRKRMMKQQADEVTRRSGSIIKSLLPVLDALDYGVGHGDESARAVQAQLLGVLATEGLERVGEPETPFDPEQHEAVSHEPGDEAHQVVAEVLRAGYRWQGHLVRPAMVRVRG